ncbi:DUF3653 domain-containing protein [Aeromonas veronii]
MASGRELPTIWKEWEGWRMKNDCLVSPTGVTYDRRRLEAIARRCFPNRCRLNGTN